MMYQLYHIPASLYSILGVKQ